MEPWQFKRNWSAGYRCGEGGDIMIISGKPTGVVRVSIGAMTTIADVDTFLNFLAVAYAEAGADMGSVDASFVDDLGVVHLGLEVMKSRDIGFDVGHQELPRMTSSTSSPNLRSPITTKLNSSTNYDRRDAGTYRIPRTSFLIQRPDAAASKISSYERGYQAAINELHVPPAPMYQRRPETTRSKLAVNDGFPEFVLTRGDLGREYMNNQKGRTLLKFWKSRKA
jgi:molybdenum cofactor sulfurtransferase